MERQARSARADNEDTGFGYTEIPLISSYASISLARIASSVLNARSDFSTAVITPLMLSVFPSARFCTALLASCCSRDTSSMLCFSVSAKLAPPVSPAAGRTAQRSRDRRAVTERMLVGSIMKSRYAISRRLALIIALVTSIILTFAS